MSSGALRTSARAAVSRADGGVDADHLDPGTVDLGLAGAGIPDLGQDPRRLAAGPLVRVIAREGELVHGAALLGEALGGDPAGRVARLHGLEVVEVGLGLERPLQQRQVLALGAGERSLAVHRRLFQRALAELAERRVDGGAGGRDRDHPRPGALQHRRPQGVVEVAAGVGVKLVDDRQVEDQAVLLGAVGGDHLQPAVLGADLAPGGLDQRGDLGMAGVAAGEVEEDRGLIPGRGADDDLGVGLSQQRPQRDRGEQRGLAVAPWKQGDRLAARREDLVDDRALEAVRARVVAAKRRREPRRSVSRYQSSSPRSDPRQLAGGFSTPLGARRARSSATWAWTLPARADFASRTSASW